MSIGDQTLHTELRVRTLCELVLNEEHYLQPSVMSLLSPDGHEISKNAVIGTSASYDEALNRVHTGMEKDAAKTVFRLDCLDTAKNGTFSNILHVHAPYSRDQLLQYIQRKMPVLDHFYTELFPLELLTTISIQQVYHY